MNEDMDMSESSHILESWISAFCNVGGHEYFAEVSEDFIEDDFNLTGLSSQVPLYKEALEMILDVEPEEDEEEEEEEEEEDEDEDEDEAMGEGGEKSNNSTGNRRRGGSAGHDLARIETAAELLYGLIHQRYITSRPGIGQMHEKYDLGHFGVCPRVYCNGSKVLPVGCSDVPGQETVKLFCPSCLDIYTPPHSRYHRVDGAFFGTTFGCLFFMTFPELQISRAAAATSDASEISPTNGNDNQTETSQALTSANKRQNQPLEINGISTSNLAPGLGIGNIYEPRIYGFKVSEQARSGPRMKWLRQKPEDIRQLDEARRYHSLGDDISLDEEEEMDEDIADNEEDEDEEIDENEAAKLYEQQQQQRQQQQQVDKRKKAPIRRRRRTAASANTAEGAIISNQDEAYDGQAAAASSSRIGTDNATATTATNGVVVMDGGG